MYGSMFFIVLRGFQLKLDMEVGEWFHLHLLRPKNQIVHETHTNNINNQTRPTRFKSIIIFKAAAPKVKGYFEVKLL